MNGMRNGNRLKWSKDLAALAAKNRRESNQRYSAVPGRKKDPATCKHTGPMFHKGGSFGPRTCADCGAEVAWIAHDMRPAVLR